MTQNAIIHLDEAMRLLAIEAWRGKGADTMEAVAHYTIAEELERVDRALGPRGTSMFSPIADAIRSAYVEIRAARNALAGETE